MAADASSCIWLFMLGGMKRELVPGRWQMAVEGFTGFIADMMDANIGPAGRKYVPYVFSLFMFILFANLLGMLPVGAARACIRSRSPAISPSPACWRSLSFAIVLIVGFGKHGLHFFSLFVPHGTPRARWSPLHLPDRADQLPGAPVQPRPATVRGDDRRAHPDGSARRLRHQRAQRRGAVGRAGRRAAQLHPDDRHHRCSSCWSCAIQAYVFALLTSLYLNDAINLH